MKTPLVRAGLSLLSSLAGIAMIAAALHSQSAPTLAQSQSDCYAEGGYYCGSGQACCNGTCYDPMYFTCSCTGVLEPVEY